MSSAVSIMAVAKAAGVSKTTVSRVLNGKLDRFRIGRDAQERVRAVARQMGYQPDPIARNVALGKGAPARSPRVTAPVEQSQVSTVVADRREIGLILSVNSPTDSLVLLPGLEPSLAVAGYRLVMITVPADPVAARQRLVQFLGDGLSGILCCPSVYQATLATVAGKCPVVVLWAGAGKAMVATLAAPQQSPMANDGTSTPVTVNAPAVATPPPPIVTAPPPVAVVPPAPANKPALVVPLPVAISTPVELEPEPAVSPGQPVIAVEPAEEPIPAVPVPEPVIVEEVPELPVAVDPPVAVVEPVVEPIPAVPVQEPVIAEEVAPESAIAVDPPVAVVEPVVEPIPAVPVQEPVIIEEVAPELPAAVDPPVAVLEPVVEPIPAVPAQEPVIIEEVAPESAIAVDPPVATVAPTVVQETAEPPVSIPDPIPPVEPDPVAVPEPVIVLEQVDAQKLEDTLPANPEIENDINDEQPV